MQATEKRTVAFSLPRPNIKNATAQFLRLLHRFKGTPFPGLGRLFEVWPFCWLMYPSLESNWE